MARKKTWRLKRVKQCEKCPWRVDVDPFDIPNGYDVGKHCALKSTIADDGDVYAQMNKPVRSVMACHETDNAYCIGWLHNQLGVGNNVALRIHVLGCENISKMQIVGDQHQRFEDTLPSREELD